MMQPGNPAGGGIGGAAGAGAPPTVPGQPPAAPEGGEEAAPNVSPEEQAQYDQFVTNGMALIYKDGKVSDAVLGHLSGKWEDLKPLIGDMQGEQPLQPGPIDNLAMATVGIVLALENSATGADLLLDGAVVFHGGAELMEQLVEVAEQAGLHEYTPDDMEGALNRAALIYGVSSRQTDKEGSLKDFEAFLQQQGPTLEAGLAAEQQAPANGA